MTDAELSQEKAFMTALIERMPKVELHLHIEGTFEPELMFAIAQRNNVKLPFDSVEALRAAYQFENLQSFLDIYYQGMNVLLHEQDFYDLTYAYFTRVAKDNVRHTEIMFDPQGHTSRGVAFDTVIAGIWRAKQDAEAKLGITSHLILSFLRHLSEEDAFKTLEEAKPHIDKFIACGLDSSEVGNPPEKFQRVYAACRELGLKAVAHAGEEGPASYIIDALDLLKCSRIDHGVRALDDEAVIARLMDDEVPLTVCPLSNEKLQVVKVLKDHNLKDLLNAGMRVTVNSDDPAYFGGYMNDNYLACLHALDLRAHDIVTMARYSIDSAFLKGARRVALHRELSEVVAQTEKEFSRLH
eukprot:CAMPEP_0174852800 /NCGR_PEP_ID=MMETSP1114-20130205/26822_1 /TAXON_ID=312471 /ORGANISM="Neobodo designis, Strain CCAP 1951/1" /LENGTH=354 /DNA_ID=CAMNT_0016087417 /DNA_START=46 /DNA_END=1110 /DNA_ORIENTATION=+